VNEILSKISSYNIFNYLFPGAVFTVIADRLDLLPAPDDNIIEQLLWYYFVGLVISRVGSVLLEPALRKIGFVKYSDYASYLRACTSDPKMDVMVEVANTYRTLAAAFGLLIATGVTVWVVKTVGLAPKWQDYSAIVLLLALFLASLRKQVDFVTKRVGHFCGGSE